ncbi:MAG: preprotein translocase subunit TatC, partial [Pleurocapsa sp. SU_196_0]|nr:preprotein translocase subunit TatC [Pleurocapsa sp. SU_196_0]
MARTRQLKADNFKEAPLIDHLEELRWRVIWSAVAWIVGGFVTFQFLNVVSDILKRPLNAFIQGKNLDVELVQLRIAEGFT